MNVKSIYFNRIDQGILNLNNSNFNFLINLCYNHFNYFYIRFFLDIQYNYLNSSFTIYQNINIH